MLNTPARRIGAIVSVIVAPVVISFLGMFTVQMLSPERENGKAVALAWLVIILAFVACVLVAWTIYLSIASYRWIMTGYWMTPDEFRQELKEK